jgi:hypothetical protein
MDIIKQGAATQMVESAQIGMDRIAVQRDEHDSFVELAQFANARIPYEPPKMDRVPSFSPIPSPEPSVHPDEQPVFDNYQPAPSLTSYKSPEDVRKEKSLLLYELEMKNKGNKYSSMTWSMDDSIEDIRNELELIKSRRDMENSVGFWKRALLLSSEALVMGNSYFDPFGVDMSDWSRAVYWDVNNSATYEQVLEEIALKYKSSIRSPPEIRLLFLLLSSFGTAVVVKKQEEGLYRQLGLRQQQQRSNTPPPQPSTTPPVPPSLPSHLLEKIGRPTEPPQQRSTVSAEEMRNIVKSMEVESSRASSPAPSETSSIVSSVSVVPETPKTLTPARSVASKRGRGRGRGAKVMVAL